MKKYLYLLIMVQLAIVNYVFSSETDDIFISSGPDTIQFKKPFTYIATFDDWEGNGTYVDFWNWSAGFIHNDSVYTILSKDSVEGFSTWQCSWTDSIIHIPLPFDSISGDKFYIHVNCFDSDSCYHFEYKANISIIDSTVLSIPNFKIVHPDKFILYQNFPNPFNPNTTIPFYCNNNQKVKILIYDVHGRKLCTLTNRFYSIGDHTVNWYGKNDSGVPVQSGVYFYRLYFDDKIMQRKMVLIK